MSEKTTNAIDKDVKISTKESGTKNDDKKACENDGEDITKSSHVEEECLETEKNESEKIEILGTSGTREKQILEDANSSNDKTFEESPKFEDDSSEKDTTSVNITEIVKNIQTTEVENMESKETASNTNIDEDKISSKEMTPDIATTAAKKATEIINADLRIESSTFELDASKDSNAELVVSGETRDNSTLVLEASARKENDLIIQQSSDQTNQKALSQQETSKEIEAEELSADKEKIVNIKEIDESQKETNAEQESCKTEAELENLEEKIETTELVEAVKEQSFSNKANEEVDQAKQSIEETILEGNQSEAPNIAAEPVILSNDNSEAIDHDAKRTDILKNTKEHAEEDAKVPEIQPAPKQESDKLECSTTKEREEVLIKKADTLENDNNTTEDSNVENSTEKQQSSDITELTAQEQSNLEVEISIENEKLEKSQTEEKPESIQSEEISNTTKQEKLTESITAERATTTEPKGNLEAKESADADNMPPVTPQAIASEKSNAIEALKNKLKEKQEKSLTTTQKNVDDIMTVIEIDDDIDEVAKNQQTDANKEDGTLENETVKETTENDKMTDSTSQFVIEIDDDDDDGNCNDKSNKANTGETKTDETIVTQADNKSDDDDDEQGPKTDISKSDEAAIAKMHTMPMIFYKKECINFECPKTHKEFHRAPQFALNYFKISKKKMKVQYICGDCYDMTLNFYQEFCGILEAKQPILMKTIPNKKQEFVEILDSSDEDENETTDMENKEQENPSFSTADLELIEAELENTIRNVFDKVEIQNQLTWTRTIFTERVKKLQEELEYIDSELGETQKIADRMYNDLYDSGKYRINTLRPLDLDTPINEPIPPLGEVERPTIKVGGIYYAARNKAISTWMPCKVNEQVDNYLFVPHYRIKFLNTQVQPFKNISAKLIAYYDPPTTRLAVGQRVIAYFDASTLSLTEKEKSLVKSAFYPGIIAEEMKPNNFYRYLIFYDDGYTQYVSHKDVRLVCHVARNVWEDVDHVSREFIKKYVQEYRVNRPMVQTHKGQKMCTEKHGRWVPARVIDIDCSLVRMQFEGHKGNHTEWIYRGSLRLNPVYNEYQKSKNNAPASRTPISRLPRRTEPFIRYTDDEENLSAQQQQQQQHQQQQTSRTLNRSNSTSSAASSSAPTVRHLNANTIYLEDEKPKGKVIYYTAKRQMPTRVYRPHECGPHCLIVIPHNLNGYNPLAKPLLSGWERLFSRQKIKKTVYYRGPCGKMFRNMRELHHYLRLTKCSLNVDNFDFYAETSCLAEFEAENVHLKKRDISNGQEKMPLPLINYYDDTLPECTYSAKVIPTEGVNINTDTDFLICCDCEDDCVDKSKCACWKLTVEGVKTTNPDAQIDDIGYQYKRLYDHLPTGIYECNSRCKCKSHCLNRVVQHSLGLKLQVFKTTNRGWGLRCLNDIPRGSFVCVYAGNLLTEAKANEGGLDAGDEYFAELDYIETVEQLKEGYESDVEAPDEDDEDSYEPEAEDDVDFQPSRSVERRVRRGTSSGGNNDGERQAINFNPKVTMEDDSKKKRLSVRQLFGKDEAVYVMDAKVTGNLGRYFNHSCSPNLFVQNVFVDTHDIRFPCVAFFSLTHIRAGTELTWNYNYEVGVVPGKVLYCQCGAPNCRQRLL